MKNQLGPYTGKNPGQFVLYEGYETAKNPELRDEDLFTLFASQDRVLSEASSSQPGRIEVALLHAPSIDQSQTADPEGGGGGNDARDDLRARYSQNDVCSRWLTWLYVTHDEHHGRVAVRDDGRFAETSVDEAGLQLVPGPFLENRPNVVRTSSGKQNVPVSDLVFLDEE